MGFCRNLKNTKIWNCNSFALAYLELFKKTICVGIIWKKIIGKKAASKIQMRFTTESQRK